VVACFGTAFAGTVRLSSETLDFESVLFGDGPVHLEARGPSARRAARVDPAEP
jgi:hypothetical protein